jgi:hypothetical protein
MIFDIGNSVHRIFLFLDSLTTVGKYRVLPMGGVPPLHFFSNLTLTRRMTPL